MSVMCMAWAWQIKALQPSQKLVLLRLADHAHDDGVCWPGKHHLAEYCGISKRSVDTAVASLIKKGLVRVRRRQTERGTDASNIYELQIVQRDLFQFVGSVTEETAKGADIAPQGADQEKEPDSRGATSVNPGVQPRVQSLHPNRKTKNHNKRATVGVRARGQPDYSDWQPAAATIERIKMQNAKITDQFLEEILPEFLIFAEEAGIRRDRLNARFYKNAFRQLLRSENKPSFGGPPKDPEELAAWVIVNDAPGAKVGESPVAYHRRLYKWISDGRPAGTQAKPVEPVRAAPGCLQDEMDADHARLAQ